MRIFYVYKEDKCNFSPGEVKREKRKGKKANFYCFVFWYRSSTLNQFKKKKNVVCSNKSNDCWQCFSTISGDFKQWTFWSLGGVKQNGNNLVKLVLNKTGTTSISAEKSFIKAGLSSSKKTFVSFNQSPVKMMKSAFYSTLKPLFVLKIFKFLC